ncbi:Uncharacterised protein g9288 [Pycnogonum litorale]
MELSTTCSRNISVTTLNGVHTDFLSTYGSDFNYQLSFIMMALAHFIVVYSIVVIANYILRNIFLGKTYSKGFARYFLKLRSILSAPFASEKPADNTQIATADRTLKIFSRTLTSTACELAQKSYLVGYDKICIDYVRHYNLDVNSVDSHSHLSIFLCACVSGNTDVIRFMLQRGGDLRQKSTHGDTVLHLVTFGYLHHPNPDMTAIRLLIDKGVDVNERNNSGYTVLHQAATNGDASLVNYFIGKGAKVNVRNTMGITPIHCATIFDHRELVTILNRKGCDRPAVVADIDEDDLTHDKLLLRIDDGNGPGSGKPTSNVRKRLDFASNSFSP